MPTINLAHFNDVYRVSPQKLSYGTIDVSQFAALLDQIRRSWPADHGLTLFSGDLFSPSVESSVTRGSHMVPVMNLLAPDASMAGNHDFDFGYPHLTKLVQDMKFPWLLSNIIDETTGQVPEYLHEYHILERAGLKIGIIGLVEKEWIVTVSSWPPNFVYKDMTEVGMRLSEKLRGELGCDIVLALTHCRVPNDVALAKTLFALSPKAQKERPLANQHGVDILLGGHDHLYYASKGVDSWEGYDVSKPMLGTEKDEGDILVVKSGMDFRELSEITLDLEETPPGSVRKYVIGSIKGKRYTIQPDSEKLPAMTELLKSVLGTVSGALKVPVCVTEVMLDVRSRNIRIAESAAGNWFADVLRCVYDEALCMKGSDGADGVFICAGTLRGDSTYGPGVVTLGDILEILPFEDPVVVLELDGAAIWDALEAGLTTWPAQEGRFPVISGFRVSWDSRRPPGQRVLGVWLLKESDTESESGFSSSGAATPQLIDGLEIKRETGGRKYNIITREYMAGGHDGYTAFKDKKYLIDDESGQLMSTLVRRYLMGSHFVNRMARLRLESSLDCSYLNETTQKAIEHERTRKQGDGSSAALLKFKRAVEGVITEHRRRSKAHFRALHDAPGRDHMSEIDIIDGSKARRGEEDCVKVQESPDRDLLRINPSVDGRFEDVARM